MAANGFFGFTPGGTQFGAGGPQAYQQGNASFGVGSSGGQFGGGGSYGNSFQGNQSHTGVLPTMSSDGNQQNGGWGSGFRKNSNSRGFRGGGRGRGRGGRMGFGGSSGSPKATQPLHYCDVCRISCAGSQTYEEHLKGSKHKKKEAAAKAGAAASLPKGGSALHCELCDVACTGSDAYAAHIRGSKHQRVVKLHQKLGKPIPSHEPTIISNKEGEEREQSSDDGKASSSGGNDGRAVEPTKVQFVETPTGEKIGIPKLPEEHDSEPIGVDYIEDMKGPGDKLIGYKCKLCECQFNDVNAKDMHLKGRRHRAQYKKKVDPTIEVAMKPMNPNKQRGHPQPDFFGGPPHWGPGMAGPGGPDMGRPFPDMWMGRFGPPGPMGMGGMMRPGMPPPMFGFFPGPPMPFMGPDMGPRGPMPHTVNDRFVLAKAAEVKADTEDLDAIHKVLGHVEKALKVVSDLMAEDDKKNNANQPDGARSLKGVMRVGDVAKRLLMKGERTVRLVVLCGIKPTQTLLNRVLELLPKELETVAGNKDDKYEINPHGGVGFTVTPIGHSIGVVIIVALTSALMRQDNVQAVEPQGVDKDGKGSAGGATSPSAAASATPTDPHDLLDREKCLEALAQLRHFKWFQAKILGSETVVRVILVVKDLANRVPSWSVMKPWALELLVHYSATSIGGPFGPGDLIKRVFECLSSGILLPGGPGLLDPCEKEATDAAAGLTAQEREDLTTSAQAFLRLFVYRQLFKVLAMDEDTFVRRRAAAIALKRGAEPDADDSPEKKVKTETPANGDAEAVVKTETAETN